MKKRLTDKYGFNSPPAYVTLRHAFIRMGKVQQQSVFLIFGTDEGMVSEKATRLFSDLTEGTNEFSHEILDANVPNADTAEQVMRQLIEALRTLPFFPGRKVVWLKNCNFLGAAGRAAAGEAALRQLLESGLGEDVMLVISASSFDKRSSFNKFLIQCAATEEYNLPDINKAGWETSLIPLVKKESAQRSLSFQPAALDMFIHRVSESSRQIIAEIEKLDLYLGAERRVVTCQDVKLLVPLTRTGGSYELSQALMHKKVDAAISFIDFKLERDESAVSIMRRDVIPAVTNLLLAKILMSEFNLKALGYKEFSAKLADLPSHAAALIPVTKEGKISAYPLFLAAQQTPKFTTERLKHILKECMKADKALVSSSLDSRLILHQLAICIAS